MSHKVIATCPICKECRQVIINSKKDIIRKCKPCARPRSIGKTYVDNNGYVRIYTKDGERYEHRHVWEIHNGKIPKGLVIHHCDGDRTNNDIENLEIMSKRNHDSLTTKERHCKILRGEIPKIITHQQKDFPKEEIISYLKQGLSIRQISKIFKVSHTCMRNNLRRYSINYKDYK